MQRDQVGRVFVISRPSVKRDGSTLDLKPLEEHGPITYLVDEHIKPSRTPDTAFELIDSRLDNFDHKHDMVAWAGGDMLSAIMAGVVLADLDIPYFYFLRYERDYDPVTRRRFSTGHYEKVKILMDATAEDENQLKLFPTDEEGDADDNQR